MASSKPEAFQLYGSSMRESAPYSTMAPQQGVQGPSGTSQQQGNPPPIKDMHWSGVSPEVKADPSESWTVVEAEMKKEDEATMKGHMEDVDYLLVFAGLFSAVLTAFVVESYQQLQPDNQETSSKLLRRISIQLESFTLTSSFANSTLPVPALPSLDFTVDTIARWINILWFLSLIFSLAAALFGILVKQWIREYMKWNAALAHARDNVLMRQIRYEAWHDWNVPATIAAVPALLEIALVLFVCGLVILLWTLDPVVSAVITTAAAVFLAIASTFTVLPAFFRRCPYKSPTAWAFAIFWDFLILYIPHKLRSLQFSLGIWLYSSWTGWGEQLGKWLKDISGRADSHPRIGSWTAFAHDWRNRDLASLWSSGWPGTKRGDATPVLEELRLERTGPGPRTNFVTPDTSQYPPNVMQSLPTVFHDAQRVITELSPLFRALAWISQASQDARTQAHIISSAESLATRFTLPDDLRANEKFITDFFDEDGVRAVSYWNLAMDLVRQNARNTGRKPIGEERRSMDASPADLWPAAEPKWDNWNASLDGNSPEVPPFAHLLAPSVRTLSRTLSNPVSSEASPRLYPRNVLRLRQYLAVLAYFFYACGRSMPNVGDHLYDTFVEMVNREPSSQTPLFSDWKQTMLEVIYVHQSPKLKKLMDELELDGRSSLSPGNVSKIITALSSAHTNTSHSQGVQPVAAIQDLHKVTLRTDKPIGDAPRTSAVPQTIHPASSKSSHSSASLPPTAQPSPQYPPHHPLLALRAPFGAPGDSGYPEANEGGRLVSAVLAEGEQDTSSESSGPSPSQSGWCEHISTALPSNAHTPPGGPVQLDPSSSRIVGSIFPPPSHVPLGEEPLLLTSDARAEEDQKTAQDLPSTSSRSPSQSDSSEQENVSVIEEAVGDTLEPPIIDRTPSRAPTPDLSSFDATNIVSPLSIPLIVSIEHPGRYGGAVGIPDLHSVSRSGNRLDGQPQDEGSLPSAIMADKEQKTAGNVASYASSSGQDNQTQPADFSTKSPQDSQPTTFKSESAPPPHPSSSYNVISSSLHSRPSPSATPPPQRSGDIGDPEADAADKSHSHGEGRNGNLLRSSAPAVEELGVATNNPGAEA